MLTDSYLRELTSAGLFAWSFMDTKNLSASESIYQFAKDAVTRYGASPPVSRSSAVFIAFQLYVTPVFHNRRDVQHYQQLATTLNRDQKNVPISRYTWSIGISGA